MDDVAAGTRNVSLSITAVMAYAYVLSLPTARACHVRLSSLPCRPSLESLLRGNAPVQGSVLQLLSRRGRARLCGTLAPRLLLHATHLASIESESDLVHTGTWNIRSQRI